MDLIIRNVNLNDRKVDIGISNEKIVEIQKEIPGKGTQEIDGKNRICIPGFVDVHLHLDKSFLNEESPYRDVTGPEKGALTRERKKNFTVEDIENRAEKVIIHALKSGSRYIRTNVDVDDLVEVKGIQALLNLREKYKGLIDIQITAFSQEGFVNYPKTESLLEEALQMGADLVGGHTIADGNKGKEHIDIVLKLARKYNVEAEFHLDESGERKHYLLPYLAKRIIEENLEGKVTGIHACTLSSLDENEKEKAYEYIKKSKLQIATAPTAISTRSLAPIKELLQNGIPVAIGSDNVRDFFNPLGSGDVKQVALLLAYVQRFYTDNEFNEIWNMITKAGASFLRVENYGVFEGEIADFIILDETERKEALAKQSQPWLTFRQGKKYTTMDLDKL